MFSVVRSGFTPPPFKSEECLCIMCRQKEARGKQVATLEVSGRVWTRTRRMICCLVVLGTWLTLSRQMWHLALTHRTTHDKSCHAERNWITYTTLWNSFRGLPMWPSSIHSWKGVTSQKQIVNSFIGSKHCILIILHVWSGLVLF